MTHQEQPLTARSAPRHAADEYAPRAAWTPVSVQLLDNAQLVREGLVGMLRPFADQVTLVEGHGSAPALPDVVLFDCVAATMPDEDAVVCRPAPVTAGHRVVAYTWEVNPELVDGTTGWGYDGYVSKALPARALVDALERIRGGEMVVAPCIGSRHHPHREVLWLGFEVGLTRRESEVIALVTGGVSNQEIADLLFITINSVKSYVRTAYRKIGAATRSQAVLWGIRHGFQPLADGSSTLKRRPQHAEGGLTKSKDSYRCASPRSDEPSHP